MGLFDKLKSDAVSAAKSAAKQLGTKTESVVFNRLPDNLEQFKALPQAAMTDPFDTAAMTILALCFFPQDKELCYQMVDFLRGPRTMTGQDRQFIADRFRSKDYMVRSYFTGATPENDYTPAEPYTVVVKSDPHSYDQENMARLYLISGGCDPDSAARPVTLRKAKDDKWYLWEYSSLLLGVKEPGSANPWA